MTAWATWTTQGILSGPGGVDTLEAGPIYGDLTLHTTWSDHTAVLTVQYTGASEWFTVTGSPVPADTEHQARTLHQHMVDAAKKGHAATAPPPPDPAG
ncbi:hypothetical protein AB0442_38965 [Kitasatospora sp. NPDC085895]|uniref:hypothetical protein n=1 Tax=Kitasatospora sp. NPDC085895 TaxID=3155057 RepID=UPI003450B468